MHVDKVLLALVDRTPGHIVVVLVASQLRLARTWWGSLVLSKQPKKNILIINNIDNIEWVLLLDFLIGTLDGWAFDVGVSHVDILDFIYLLFNKFKNKKNCAKTRLAGMTDNI